MEGARPFLLRPENEAKGDQAGVSATNESTDQGNNTIQKCAQGKALIRETTPARNVLKGMSRGSRLTGSSGFCRSVEGVPIVTQLQYQITQACIIQLLNKAAVHLLLLNYVCSDLLLQLTCCLY